MKVACALLIALSCCGCVTKTGSRTVVSLTVPYGTVSLSVLFEPCVAEEVQNGAGD